MTPAVQNQIAALWAETTRLDDAGEFTRDRWVHHIKTEAALLGSEPELEAAVRLGQRHGYIDTLEDAAAVLDAGVQQDESLTTLDFNPDQQRGADGRWGEGDGAAHSVVRPDGKAFYREVKPGDAAHPSQRDEQPKLDPNTYEDRTRTDPEMWRQLDPGEGRFFYEGADDAPVNPHEWPTPDRPVAVGDQVKSVHDVFGLGIVNANIVAEQVIDRVNANHPLAAWVLNAHPLDHLMVGQFTPEMHANGCFGITPDGKSSLSLSTRVEPLREPWKPGQIGSVSSTATNVRQMQELVMVHEIGHHLAELPEVKKHLDEAWAARNDYSHAVSKYAETDKHEYFAETFAAYSKDPKGLHEADYDGYHMMERSLGELERKGHSKANVDADDMDPTLLFEGQERDDHGRFGTGAGPKGEVGEHAGLVKGWGSAKSAGKDAAIAAHEASKAANAATAAAAEQPGTVAHEEAAAAAHEAAASAHAAAADRMRVNDKRMDDYRNAHHAAADAHRDLASAHNDAHDKIASDKVDAAQDMAAKGVALEARAVEASRDGRHAEAADLHTAAVKQSEATAAAFRDAAGASRHESEREQRNLIAGIHDDNANHHRDMAEAEKAQATTNPAAQAAGVVAREASAIAEARGARADASSAAKNNSESQHSGSAWSNKDAATAHMVAAQKHDFAAGLLGKGAAATEHERLAGEHQAKSAGYQARAAAHQAEASKFRDHLDAARATKNVEAYVARADRESVRAVDAGKDAARSGVLFPGRLADEAKSANERASDLYKRAADAANRAADAHAKAAANPRSAALAKSNTKAAAEARATAVKLLERAAEHGEAARGAAAPLAPGAKEAAAEAHAAQPTHVVDVSHEKFAADVKGQPLMNEKSFSGGVNTISRAEIGGHTVYVKPASYQFEPRQAVSLHNGVFKTAEALGVGHMVQPAVVKPGDGFTMTGQSKDSFVTRAAPADHITAFVQAPKALARVSEHDRLAGALIDHIHQNTDRHGENVLVNKDGHMTLIDHDRLHNIPFGKEDTRTIFAPRGILGYKSSQKNVADLPPRFAAHVKDVAGSSDEKLRQEYGSHADVGGMRWRAKEIDERGLDYALRNASNS